MTKVNLTRVEGVLFLPFVGRSFVFIKKRGAPLANGIRLSTPKEGLHKRRSLLVRKMTDDATRDVTMRTECTDRRVNKKNTGNIELEYKGRTPLGSKELSFFLGRPIFLHSWSDLL